LPDHVSVSMVGWLTVRHRGMETGISEASKIFPLLPREASK
jgi:hypothetical protein